MKQIEVVYPGPYPVLEIVIPVTGENVRLEKGVPFIVNEDVGKRLIEEQGCTINTKKKGDN